MVATELALEPASDELISARITAMNPSPQTSLATAAQGSPEPKLTSPAILAGPKYAVSP